MSLLHLKVCCLKDYGGSEWEFVFVRYVKQNARSLRDMTLSCSNKVNEGEKHEMLRRLSLCTRLSPTCTL
ncbi:hypothetical protein JHK82_045435 [Glycine max]|uniref:FBD domain-containing protein n=2 Tax=Glycine subgen. Soja TaxID=1462606 RepID=K7MIM0_SOYBN|nr:hypothetical protein JHK85_046406 [Glycine max]KAG5100383.1 hypothetical protein JHK82_045435 [Glycine max]KAG5108968.1 hypothetical protein JHK84_045875 [Glycine max]KAH1152069.1 hypothetical protein GYH30_045524 [Glycine max]RZB61806.1 hypothetical protein D0Y65_044207 [Glycine soja]